MKLKCLEPPDWQLARMNFGIFACLSLFFWCEILSSFTWLAIARCACVCVCVVRELSHCAYFKFIAADTEREVASHRLRKFGNTASDNIVNIKILARPSLLVMSLVFIKSIFSQLASVVVSKPLVKLKKCHHQKRL
jgi:hypothetical protein